MRHVATPLLNLCSFVSVILKKDIDGLVRDITKDKLVNIKTEIRFG